MELLCLAVLLLSTPLLTLCDPLYVLSAPNLLRVGSSENVMVEAQDYSGADINVKIMVKNYPKKNVEILFKAVTLSVINNFQILTDIQIKDFQIPNGRSVFTAYAGEKQYVYLQAEFPSITLEKVVMVSFQSGYIFVQTDKPLYTPSSTVQYRIFSLDAGLKPHHEGITVDIQDPQGFVALRETVFPIDGIRSGKYAIPDLSSPGIWKVVTMFRNAPQKNFTTSFEVKEYVLPTYEVTLSPNQSFFHVDDVGLTVDVEARYLHGNTVRGHAFLVFGVMDGERMISIPSSLQRIQILDGRGHGKLSRMMILQSFPDLQQLLGQFLYISASVITDTGSEMVEAQRTGIKIVTSPYIIHFKRTPHYFKPGMPFDISVYVTDPEQMPVENLEVEVNPGGVRGQTKANGIAKLTVNSQGGFSTLEISAQTKDPQLSDDHQAEKKMTAQAYKTRDGSNNFLHVGIDAAELQIGDQMKVNLNLGKSPGVRDQDFTYMILSKGQIVKVERFKRRGESLVTLSLPVTKDMVPSFRFVAYYHVGSAEIVADSVWVDVKDTCMGTLSIQVKEPRPIYEPGERFSLLISGDPAAKVGLVAVDKAVHGLNKNRLTQTKIWDFVEKHDVGCTAGGGSDSMGVFFDAGLLFESNTAGGTNIRIEPECHISLMRKRRAEHLQQVTTTLAGKYSGEQKKCCVDGMRDNKLAYSCERRATYIMEGSDCVEAFLDCCNTMTTQSTDAGEEELALARSESSDFYESFDEITSRTQFPESWLWSEEVLTVCPNRKKSCLSTSFVKDDIYLKESITTWQIFAVSLSVTHGICVADPLEMVVYKRFFIDLKIPPSVVRNEQVQIRAILHNYTTKKIKTRLEFSDTEHVCSSASSKGRFQTEVEVEAMSSRSVPYVVIPLELGNHAIEVKASVFDDVFSDGVRKFLKVLPEGVLTVVQEMNLQLNPDLLGGVQQVSVRTNKPNGQVPNTPANTYIKVTNEDFMKSIEQPIRGDFMSRFIVQPRGDGEENMIYMTLLVIATHYLDSIRQWETVGMHLRNEAIEHINTGYQRQLSFRKPDGSFGASMTTLSSTWLTAYVVKVLNVAADLMMVEETVLCDALKWLVINKQLLDGSFREDAFVVHEEMTGDVEGKDSDASLTAFISVALQDSCVICTGSVLQRGLKRAMEYLTIRLHSLTSSYAVAITSYALSQTGKLQKDVLMAHSNQNKAGTFWQVPGPHHLSLEATGYALFALVRAEDFFQAGQVVRWLKAQRFQYGVSGTTQASFIVFQALAVYHSQAKNYDANLNVDVEVQGRRSPNKWSFTRSSNHMTRSDKVKVMQNFTVTAEGTGSARLSVFSLYYALPEAKESDCRGFDLSVKMEKQHKTSHPEAIETFLLTIEIQFKNLERDAAMSVLDVGLLTGFKVDDGDLSKLVKGKDRYIQSYQKNMEFSERGSLIIFLKKVSNRERERLAFRLHMMNDVGVLQPAAVTIYEYNSPDERCVKFLHPRHRDGALRQLCHEDLCHCAEENCSIQKKQHVQESERSLQACSHHVDYVYKVRVLASEFSAYADVYNMSVEQVLKEGTDADVEGKVRSFLAHPNCREFMKLKEGKTYLIMGQTKSLPSVGNRLRYSLGEQTWLEYWPTSQEAQTQAFREAHINISALANQLINFGCMT